MSELYATAAKGGHEVTATCTCNETRVTTSRDKQLKGSPLTVAERTAQLLAFKRKSPFNTDIAPSNPHRLQSKASI